MREVISKTKVYSFNELTEEAQERAAFQHGMAMVEDCWWYESIFEYYQEELAKIGFLNAKIHFSIGGQGSGACFDAGVDASLLLQTAILCATTYMDANDLILAQALYEHGVLDITVVGTNCGNYSHEHTRRIDIDDRTLMGMPDDVFSTIEQTLDDIRVDMCHRIYKAVDAERDYLFSINNCRDTSEASGYEYYESGELF